MSKIKFEIELDFNSWFSPENEPKSNEEWQNFLIQAIFPSDILALDDSDTENNAIDCNSIKIIIKYYNKTNS